MIKVLLDFVIPTDDYGVTTQDRENIDMSLKNYRSLFNYVLTINTGDVTEKTIRLREELRDIANNMENEHVYFHFLGHGCVDGEGQSIGIQFVCYSDLRDILMAFKERNCHVYLNMLSSCNTSGMAQYTDCYDFLWYTDRSIVDTDTPFLLPANYLDGEIFDFANFKSQKGYPSYCESMSN